MVRARMRRHGGAYVTSAPTAPWRVGLASLGQRRPTRRPWPQTRTRFSLRRGRANDRMVVSRAVPPRVSAAGGPIVGAEIGRPRVAGTQ